MEGGMNMYKETDNNDRDDQNDRYNEKIKEKIKWELEDIKDELLEDLEDLHEDYFHDLWDTRGFRMQTHLFIKASKEGQKDDEKLEKSFQENKEKGKTFIEQNRAALSKVGLI